MFEKEIFTVGIWLGYAITVFVMLLVASFIVEYDLNKRIKYLKETKQLQKYAEWEDKNKMFLFFAKKK
jgi:hypothetical protein